MKAEKKAAPKTEAKSEKKSERKTMAKISPAAGGGTREQPWTLKTPSGTAEFIAFRDDQLDPPALVVKVLKLLGLAEVEENPKNNRMRAI